jgi:DNA-binding beta-propeller fold protein YncE
MSSKPPASLKSRVWVVNEGNFQFGNAALGLYDKKEEVYFSKVFEQSNSTDLGDVFQSMSIIDGEAYLVLNNSGKVEIIDTSNFSRVRTIKDLNSPRYIQSVSNEKAYITDLYAKGIHVLDLTSSTISHKIPASEWTEKMVLKDNVLFVSMPKSEHIYAINTLADTVIDSVSLAYGSNSMVLDKSGYLWVLCQGSQSQSKSAGLYRIDPNSLSVLNQYPMDENLNPGAMTINADGDKIYFIYNDLFEMSIDAQSLPTTPLYPSSNRVFYGLGVDPENEDIYVADAKDYVQKGQVYRLNAMGDLIHSFQTDIIPSGFYFE